MSIELGHFALTLAFAISAIAAVLGFIFWRRAEAVAGYLQQAAILQFILVAAAFASLIAWLITPGWSVSSIRPPGPTASSGTSASAVACAAWRVGWVDAGEVHVVMPGGTAPILLEEEHGELIGVRLFGTAQLMG